MKPNRNFNNTINRADKIAAPTAFLAPMTEDTPAKGLRRLAWNELVRAGDLVKNDQAGFEPWEGPSGFRADSFEKTIYRLSKENPSVKSKK